MVARAFNLSAREAEAGGSVDSGQPDLQISRTVSTTPEKPCL